MKIVTKKSIEIIDTMVGDVSYLPVPNHLLESLEITSTEHITFELVPIVDETDADSNLLNGILITNKKENGNK
jgi:hypothetical protein